MLMRLLERSFFRILPERLKRPLYLRNYSRKSGMILEELSRVPIVESGCESLGQDRIPFVILSNNVKLYGQWPTQFEREVYTCWQELITPAVTEDTIRIAIDVILRYLYPHAMPQLTAPYPRRARRCCHLQHIEAASPRWRSECSLCPCRRAGCAGFAGSCTRSVPGSPPRRRRVASERRPPCPPRSAGGGSPPADHSRA